MPLPRWRVQLSANAGAEQAERRQARHSQLPYAIGTAALRGMALQTTRTTSLFTRRQDDTSVLRQLPLGTRRNSVDVRRQGCYSCGCCTSSLPPSWLSYLHMQVPSWILKLGAPSSGSWSTLAPRIKYHAKLVYRYLVGRSLAPPSIASPFFPMQHLLATNVLIPILSSKRKHPHACDQTRNLIVRCIRATWPCQSHISDSASATTLSQDTLWLLLLYSRESRRGRETLLFFDTTLFPVIIITCRRLQTSPFARVLQTAS